MKCILTILILASVTTMHAQSVKLSWDPSPSPDVTHYRIYFGTSSRNYTGVTNACLALKQMVVLPHTGRWFFAATAVDANGCESDFSNEVVWEAKPAPPVLHGETWVRLSPVIEYSTNLVDWQSVAGEPTWFRATNEMEFFITRRLLIESVVLVDGPR
jgi:hypothetical protein